MKKFTYFFSIALVVSIAGCVSPATVRYSLQEIETDLSDDSSKKEKQAISAGLPIVVVSNVKYQLPLECMTAHRLNGQTESRMYSGVTEGRHILVKTEQRLFFGVAEARSINGETERRLYNGGDESRFHLSDKEVRNIEADAEARQYVLLTEKRSYAGQESKLYCIPGEFLSDVLLVNEAWGKVAQFSFAEES